MEFLKNMPEAPAQLAELVQVRPGRVVSMALSRVSNAQITLFAFAKGEGVDVEIYPGDSWILALEGTVLLHKEEQVLALQPGACAAIPAGKPYALHGEDDFKLLQMILHKA